MDWKKIVGSVAPILGGALGGPFGAAAGKFISDSFGIEEKEVENLVLNASPDTLLQIKHLENDFKVKMEEIGLNKEQLHAEDRDSARQMATSTSLKPQIIISTIFISGFIAVLYLIFTGGVNLEGTMKDIALFLLGILSAGITQIMNFFFGSSVGSKQKTKHLLDK